MNPLSGQKNYRISTVCKRYTDSTNHRGITVVIEAVFGAAVHNATQMACLNSHICGGYNYTRPELEH